MITTKFEVNVTDKRHNPLSAVDLVVKHNCPAIVTTPDMVASFIAARSMRRAMFKVILLVNSPNDFAMLKLRDLGQDALAADGFDIVASPRRKPIECLNEVKSLSEFINSMNPLAEIRWSLSALSVPESDYVNHLKAFHKHPCSMVRTDHRLYSEVGLEKQLEIVSSIRKTVACNIKISGNVDLKLYQKFESDQSVRFDVSIDQFNSVLKSFNEPKNELKNEQKEEEEAKKVDTETLGQDVK